MKTRLHYSDMADMMIENQYPEFFHDAESEITERVHAGQFFFGRGEYREVFFKGIHIGYGDLSLSKTTRIDIEADFESIEMHFALQGNTITFSDNDRQCYEFNKNQHNIIYGAGFKGATEWSAHENMKVFEVNLLPAFFQKYLPMNGEVFKKFAYAMEHKRTHFLSGRHGSISPQMFSVINEIIHCTRKGAFKKMIIEAKVIELLLLQFEQFNEENTKANFVLKKSDIEKLYAAQQIILANLNNPCTLITLAHQVGTNEFTLKKGFKEIFGTTVFGYLNEIKMQEARKLLIERSLTVNEVSELSGYKNATHFTAAFKRKFGVLPSKIKRSANK